MDLINSLPNFVVPPASMVMLAFASFINACEWVHKTLFISEDMEGKVVIITGASSGIGEAANAALINFYETLRFEVKDEVGITVATHGWIGTEMTSGKFMVDEGAEMQWKKEREVHASGGPVEEEEGEMEMLT